MDKINELSQRKQTGIRFFSYLLHITIIITVLILCYGFLCAEAFASETLNVVVLNSEGNEKATYEIPQSFTNQDLAGVEISNDFPLIPVRLLADICQVLLGWETTANGSAMIWARSELGVVIPVGQNQIFVVNGVEYTNEPAIYNYQMLDKPVLINGQLHVTLEYFPYLGIDYKLSPETNSIIISLPKSGYNTTEPSKFWRVTKDKVDELLKPQSKLLASATTSYNPKDYNRTQNLYLASKSLNGEIIKPGKTFSFNRCLGERTPEKGYKKAIIYSGKEKVLGYGGGICQVSTTLYQAANKAGMKITERHSHSMPVPYANSTNDATVAWGSKDLKFANRFKEDVYIIAKMKGSKLTIEIWQGELPKSLPEPYSI